MSHCLIPKHLGFIVAIQALKGFGCGGGLPEKDLRFRAGCHIRKPTREIPMFGISGEHLLVLLVILLIFGPRRLPDLGHSIGRTLKNFKDAMNQNPLDDRPAPRPANAARAEETPKAAAPAAASATAAASQEPAPTTPEPSHKA